MPARWRGKNARDQVQATSLQGMPLVHRPGTRYHSSLVGVVSDLRGRGKRPRKHVPLEVNQG